MSIRPDTVYPGQVLTGDPGYPYGKARNITVPGDGTGTPWEEKWVNDQFGFQQQLLNSGGKVPSGVPDAVGASDYEYAITQISKQAAHRIAVAGHAAFNPATSSFLPRCAVSGVAGSTPLILVGGAVAGAAQLLYTDGNAWVSLALPVVGVDMVSIVYTGTRWVGCGQENLFYANAATPSTWTNLASPAPGGTILQNICKHGTRLVMMGWDGSTSYVYTSDNDGTSWTSRAPALSSDNMRCVVSNGTRLVAVGGSSALANAVWTSDDGGVTWIRRTAAVGAGVSYLTKAVHNGYRWAAVSAVGEIHLSDDGIAWTQSSPAGSVGWRNLFWTGALMVASGLGGVIYTARANGLLWEKVSSRDLGAADIFAAAYSPDLNVGVFASSGTVMRRTLFT